MEDKIKSDRQESKSKKVRILILSTLTITFAILAVFSFTYTYSEDVPEENIEISFIEEQNKNVNNTFKKAAIKQTKDSLITNGFTEANNEEISQKNKIELQSKLKNQFIIVVGTFGEKKNAISLFDEIIEERKYDCKIVHNGYSLYWVSVFLTENHSEAKLFMKNNKINGWIKRL